MAARIEELGDADIVPSSKQLHDVGFVILRSQMKKIRQIKG